MNLQNAIVFQKRKVLVSMKLCVLWRPEGQLFQIYVLVALINAVIIFCLLQGPAFVVVAILRSHFCRLTVPKMGP